MAGETRIGEEAQRIARAHANDVFHILQQVDCRHCRIRHPLQWQAAVTPGLQAIDRFRHDAATGLGLNARRMLLRAVVEGTFTEEE